MELRVTEERDTFVYATSPISFGGISKEDLILWMIPMVFANSLTNNGLIAFGAGCVTLWLYKRVTKRKPPGHIVLLATVWMGKLEKSDAAQKFPPLRQLARWLNSVNAKVWIDKGLIPTHTYCNTYEP